jgi:DNA polymerase
MKDLEQRMTTCTDCKLCESRTQVVFGRGSLKPSLMIVGEAPGRDEDVNGIPFIGQAGQKLNKMLAYAGIRRDDIYITNAVLCRPPNNRDPEQDELDACKDRLNQQINILL